MVRDEIYYRGFYGKISNEFKQGEPMEIVFARKFLMIVLMMTLILAVCSSLLKHWFNLKNKALIFESDEACFYGLYQRLAKRAAFNNRGE